MRKFKNLLVLYGRIGAASAETDVFRDTLRPGGHHRSMAAKFADGPQMRLHAPKHLYGPYSFLTRSEPNF
jgi:hypothetical protein